MKIKLFRIATRKSALALWQAHHIKDRLQQIYPQLKVELLGITTSGDKNITTSLSDVGGKGLFVKELEEALLADKADIAVHSMKDVPMNFPEDLTIAAICKREDPRDALICSQYSNLDSLPIGAVIGTASLRRLCQLKALRPDLVVNPLRGNIDTRLKRLDEGKFAAIILAVAGLQRLGLQHRIAEYLPPAEFLPAVGQGALGVECRASNHQVIELISILNDYETYLCVTAERAMNEALNGGCQVPIAGYATLQAEQILLRGLVGSLDGSKVLRASIKGSATDPEQLGKQVAQELLAAGANEILQSIRPSTNGFGV